MTREELLDCLADRPCDVCKFHTGNGCTKWKCIFEEPIDENKGEWIDVTNGRDGHKCSICNDYAPSYQSGNEWLSKFCPNCGADMRGE